MSEGTQRPCIYSWMVSSKRHRLAFRKGAFGAEYWTVFGFRVPKFSFDGNDI